MSLLTATKRYLKKLKTTLLLKAMVGMGKLNMRQWQLLLMFRF
jgi:hypothetical protein